MNLRSKGFSLIELMVVVTILAILAAVGLQQYQGYKIKARLGSDYLRPMERIIEEAKQYANMNGQFPTADQLGFAPDMYGSGSQTVIGVDGGSPSPGTPIATVPGTAWVQFLQQYGPNDPCRFFYIYTTFDRKGPVDGSFVSGLIYYAVDIGTTFSMYCFADESDSQLNATDNNVIPGCPSISGALYNDMVTANSGDICGYFQ